jgi:hypothetical protein
MDVPLAYYHANRAEIDAEIADEESVFENQQSACSFRIRPVCGPWFCSLR